MDAAPFMLRYASFSSKTIQSDRLSTVATRNPPDFVQDVLLVLHASTPASDISPFPRVQRNLGVIPIAILP
jgi:hypothetical protein